MTFLSERSWTQSYRSADLLRICSVSSVAEPDVQNWRGCGEWTIKVSVGRLGAVIAQLKVNSAGSRERETIGK
jgi:hypothetical protein